MKRTQRFRSCAGLGLTAAVAAVAVACASLDGLANGGVDASSEASDAGRTDAEDGAVLDGALEADAPCVIPAADPAFLSDAVDLDTSGPTVCAVRRNGQVVCWGDNAKGQLGIAPSDSGASGVMSARPVVVGVGAALRVAVGYLHACAALADGTVWCWGEGALGQTGSDGSLPPPGLSQVGTSAGTPLGNVVGLSAGAAFTCALTQGGGVQCWGDNGRMQLGTAGASQSATPVQVANLGVTTTITAGYFHACALSSGTVRCWGSDSNGELGIAPPADGGVSSPTPYAVDAPVRVIASSPDTCVIDTKSNVHCSGYNSDGQLGATTRLGNILSPFPIPELSSGDVIDIDVGMGHTCGIRRDRTAFCLSGVALDALGRGSDAGASDNAALPVLGPGSDAALLASVHLLKVGGKDYGAAGHSCAIVKPECAPAGQVYCWGKNEAGAVGDGTTTSRSRPVKVLAPL